jgi:hypothetical protein
MPQLATLAQPIQLASQRLNDPARSIMRSPPQADAWTPNDHRTLANENQENV